MNFNGVIVNDNSSIYVGASDGKGRSQMTLKILQDQLLEYKTSFGIFINNIGMPMYPSLTLSEKDKERLVSLNPPLHTLDHAPTESEQKEIDRTSIQEILNEYYLIRENLKDKYTDFIIAIPDNNRLGLSMESFDPTTKPILFISGYQFVANSNLVEYTKRRMTELFG